jgi:hypothetical protein
MTSPKQVTPDVLVENAGTVFTFCPLTNRAKEWFDENVETESWRGRATLRLGSGTGPSGCWAGAPMKESSPLTDVMEFYGVEPTLTEWLATNDAENIFDAELLESLPVEFHDEYLNRLQLHREYEAKWEARRSATKS